MTPAEAVAIREDLGLNRRRFSAAVGVSYGTLLKWQSGEIKHLSEPAAQTIRMLVILNRMGQLDEVLRRLLPD